MNAEKEVAFRYNLLIPALSQPSPPLTMIKP
ncbi:hypothetical protein PMI31_04551 [Pseudomonas sp. GM55]|nr:hypothetical protein PMI31_04551 [Pseudomonas sp. GM55]